MSILTNKKSAQNAETVNFTDINYSFKPTIGLILISRNND